MKLQALRLVNFRNFSERELRFGPGLNLLVGPNGVGKSNLLEAIYLLVVGRSFRAAQLRDLIRHGQEAFFVEGLFEKGGLTQRISFGFDGERRRIAVNDTPCSSTTQLLGNLQGTLVAPHDEELVSGSPAVRRQYLDIQLAQVDPLYVYHLTRYSRAHRQRNVLLRKRERDTLAPWEAEMARSGAYVRLFREKLVETLRERATALFGVLHAEPATLSLRYRATLPMQGLEELERGYLGQFDSQRTRELDRGHSLVGPHRDDLELLLNEQPAKLFASEGQKRLVVGALKIAEWGCLQNRAESTPLMLADDIGVSLDRVHKGHLLGHLMGMGQVFATTPDPSASLPPGCVLHEVGAAIA